MKICPVCSASNEDTNQFCSSCGAALVEGEGPASPTPAPQNKKKTGLLIVLAVVVAALVFLGIKVVPGLFTTPDKEFLQYQSQWFGDRFLSGLEALAEKKETGGFSSDLTITASTDDMEVQSYLEDLAISLKMDLAEDRQIVNADVTMMGRSMFQSTFTYEKGRFGFYLPQADSNYYVIEQSLSAGDSEGDKTPMLSDKEWRELSKSCLDVLYALVDRENVTREKDQEFTLPQQGEDCKGTVYTYAPRGKDGKAALYKLADMLEKDKALRKLIRGSVNAGTLTNGMGGMGSSGADLDEELELGLTLMAVQLRELADQIDENEDLGLTWKLYVVKKTVRMIRISEKTSGESLVYECTGEVTDPEGCRETIYMTGGAFDGSTPIHIRRSQEGDTRTGSLSQEDLFRLSYDMDLSRRSPLGIPQGNYELELEPEGEVLHLQLKVEPGKAGSTDHILILQGGPGAPQEFGYLQVTISATDKSSAQAPQFTPVDITDRSAEEQYAIFQNMWQELMQSVYSLSMDLAEQAFGENEDGIDVSDAVQCVQVELDTTYKGDILGFLDFYNNVSSDDAREQYEANIEGEVAYFFSIAGPADLEDTYNVVEASEMQTYRAEQLYKDIYAKSDYTVVSASKQSDGTFSVKVTVKPMDILTLVADNMSDHFADFTAKYDALDLEAMSDEAFFTWYYTVYVPDYYDTLLDLLEDQIPNIGYAKERSIVIQVQQSDDGALYISSDDFSDLDDLIIDYTGS